MRLPQLLKSFLDMGTKHRNVIIQMTKREILGRYRGSLLGLLWSFVTPLLLLAVYTFVFSVVFRARWPSELNSDSHGSFAVILFAGLMVNNLFVECVNRAPTLVLNNTTFVKKVIFPLQVLPLISLGSAIFHLLVSCIVLFIAAFSIVGKIPLTAIYFPLVLIPLMLTTLGISWFLAALGVYIRDIAQATSLFVTVLTFMSPIFYPISALPENLRFWVQLSPITFAVESTRDTLIFGRGIDPTAYTGHLMLGVLIAALGYTFFQKTRKGFADVL